MANCLGMELHQVNIKGAYLNRVLNEDEVLFMHHPPGYKVPGAGMCVLRLVKTLYGLKQSGRHWYQKLCSIFLELKFSQCRVDQVVFIKWDKVKRKLTIVTVHVDDCTMTATTIHLIQELKDSLCQHVEVTNLGELHWMLSLEIQCNRIGRTIHISQHAYINSILRVKASTGLDSTTCTKR